MSNEETNNRDGNSAPNNGWNDGWGTYRPVNWDAPPWPRDPGRPMYWSSPPTTAAGIRHGERDALTERGLEDLADVLRVLDELPWTSVSLSDDMRAEMEWGIAYGRWVLDEHGGEVPEPPLVPERVGETLYLYQWLSKVRRMLAEGELVAEEVLVLTPNPLPVPPMAKCPVCTVDLIGYDVIGAAGDECPQCQSILEEVQVE